jgi:hypothetical protein
MSGQLGKTTRGETEVADIGECEISSRYNAQVFDDVKEKFREETGV